MYDKQLNNLSSDSLLCFLKRKKWEREKKSNLRKKTKTKQRKKCKRSKSSYAINLLQAMVW